MTETVHTESLGFSYAGLNGFRDVSFTASAGEVSCIFGLNGSGKTTLLRVLATLALPQSGMYRVCGNDAVRDRHAARRTIFPVFDSNAHFDHLSGRENISLFLSLYGPPGPGSMDSVAARFDLDLDRPAGTYSLGMKRKLSLAEAFLSACPVLLFDEPALGLDSSARAVFFSLASEAAMRGTTVVFTTNRTEDAVYASRFWKMEKGRLSPAATAAGLVHDLLPVTISFNGCELTGYVSSPEELPDAVRNILAGPAHGAGTPPGDNDRWTPEAREKVRRAPRVLQRMITALAERYARENGYPRITPEVIDDARRRFGQR